MNKTIEALKKFCSIIVGLCILALSGLSVFSQDRQKMVEAVYVENPPSVDGLIDDECWRNISPVSGFFQYDPVNGENATEETFVWIAYDHKNVYFAFLMKDSQPEKIWAELTPRNEYENNDSITLLMDTYNDRRTSISFAVNPKGVQKNSVETIWKSGATVREDGWSAEMAIPFKSLRFSLQTEQVWGVNFERYIHRLNETDYWTNVNRDTPLLRQMGELRGLVGIQPGKNLEFFPYAGVRSSRWDGASDDKVAMGLDVKYGILPNLILDLTASPDFSEVESDPFIYQLSPYETYLRENRPFFNEGSRYFQTATRGGYGRGSVSLFYSRRIDNPQMAAKISGKTGGYSFGLLGAINDEEQADSAFSVVRLQKDIFRNSQVGLYYAGRDSAGKFNRNIGVDYSINFRDIYFLRGLSAFSFQAEMEKENNSFHILEFEREPDAGLQLNFNFQRVESDVDIQTGYISRKDFQTTELSAGYAWRFNTGKVKRVSLDLGTNLYQDSSGRQTGRWTGLRFWLDFFSRIEIDGGIDTGRSKYQIYDENEGLTWSRDFIPTLSGDIDFSWERGGFLKEISLEAGWDRRGIYTADFTAVEQGLQTSLEARLSLRPRSNLELSVSGDWIRQAIDRTGEKVFDGIAYATSLHIQLTPSLFLSTRLLGETREDQYNVDFLVGYYFGAGNIVQFSYKKSARTEALSREGGHSLTLKVSYLLRI